MTGGTVMLRFTVFNDSDSGVRIFDSLWAQESYSVDGVYLVDLAGKKKYEAIHDADKTCVCSRNIPQIAPHASINLWVKFPAPPDGVDKIGVVVPHFIPMDDVPLAK